MGFLFPTILEEISVDFSQSSFSFLESSGTNPVCVEVVTNAVLSPDLIVRVVSEPMEAEGTCEANAHIQHGNLRTLCTADVDFFAIDEVLTFSQGGSQCVDVEIIDDNFVEGTETFLLVVSTENLPIIVEANAIVNIVDDANGMYISV